MRDPQFKVNDKVHINETSGIGTVVYIERIAQRYVYLVQYPDGKKKHAQETDLIKVT